MFNEIHIGPITIYMYGLMICLGFLTALELCLVRGKRRGLSDDTIWGIFFCALVGGLAGCRILYYIVELPAIIRDPSLIFDFNNGLVVYGGIIGGAVTSFIYVRMKRHEAFLPYFDLVMPAVAIAQSIGRIGCFCAGCCWGRETESHLHIIFSHSSYAPNGLRLIPTQLISSAGDLAIGLILLLYAGRRPAKGRVASAYFMLYGTGRFLIEFLRNDPRGALGPLSTSQAISLVMIVAGAVSYARSGRLQADSVPAAA